MSIEQWIISHLHVSISLHFLNFAVKNEIFENIFHHNLWREYNCTVRHKLHNIDTYMRNRFHFYYIFSDPFSVQDQITPISVHLHINHEFPFIIISHRPRKFVRYVKNKRKKNRNEWNKSIDPQQRTINHRLWPSNDKIQMKSNYDYYFFVVSFFYEYFGYFEFFFKVKIAKIKFYRVIHRTDNISFAIRKLKPNHRQMWHSDINI